jgi:class 3 adenylate cyclase/tetratricopeptide (TPR) repeat protein
VADGDAGTPPAFDLSEYRPAHLVERIRAEGSALEGERKQVTVLFADVMESMQLAAQVDAEEWRSVMDRFLSLLCEGVHRFEGTVNKFTGDGIMALFGAPLAHEDHAQRACYAALHLREELARYAGELRRERGLNFSVRIGLNSGEVVVGGVGDDLNLDYTAIGNTVGLASRVEQLAEPGKAYMTAATASLVEGYFGLRELGGFEIKGADEPVRVFELSGVGSARTRVEAVRERGLSRFVGRDQEIGALEAALSRAHEGVGQVIGVVADPGLGKSRLCYEFVERCRARGLEVIEGHGVAHGKRIPLLPVLEMMRAYFGIEDADSDRAARDKIAGRLLLLDESFKDLLAVLFDFLGVPDPERPAPTNPEARQRQLLAAVRRLVETGGQQNWTVILVEDLHWLDPGSEVFLASLIDGLARTHTLLIANFRPEYQAAWMRRSNYQQMPLAPLGQEAMRELLRDLLGADPSLDGLEELIQARTAGNPFYIEEVVQGLLDGGTLEGGKGDYRLVRSIDEITIPPTVQAVLAARIDRLGERDKAVLQTASVIGHEFSDSVLRRVVDLPEPELAEVLRTLTAAEFIYERSLYPEAEYSFKHPLTEEVAYRSQLGPRRVRTHAAVARAIPDAYPDRCDELAALVANHWEQGDEPLEAARWNARAGAWAGQNHPSDALRHWRAVRSLASGLPDSPETAGLRFAGCLSILQFGGWRMGMAEHEIAEVYADGRAAAEQLGQPQMVAAMEGSYATTRGFLGHPDEAIASSEEVWQIAQECDDKELLTVAQTSAYWLTLVGRLADASALVEQMIESSQSDPNLGRAIFGFCARAWAAMWHGWVLFYMGRLEESRASFEEAGDLSRAYDDVETLGWTYCSYASLAWFSGESGDSLRHAREGAEIAERSGSSISLCLACLSLAFAYLVRAEWDDAQAAAERALEMVREAHTGLQYEPLILSVIADAKLGTGEYAGALEAAEEGVESAQDSKTRVHELHARLSLARAVRASEGAAARDRIADLLAATMDLALECGADSHVPQVHVELAELSRLDGDEQAYERELREARRLFEQIGATGHAAAVANQLAALPA